MARLTTRAFVGRLAGTPVFDPNGDQLWRIRDVVVMLRSDSSAPARSRFGRRSAATSADLPADDTGDGARRRQRGRQWLVNMRRFAPRPAESLIVAELLDRKVTLKSTGEQVSVIDVGIEQARQLDWVITKLFVRKPGTGFRRRGETQMVAWDEVSGLAQEMPDQPADSLLEKLDDMRPGGYRIGPHGSALQASAGSHAGYG